MNDIPRIYVACLNSYNNGQLHGEWIPVLDIDQLQQAIDALLRTSPQPNAEEWVIHDYDGWHGYKVDEYHDLVELVEVANGIAEYGAAYAVYVEYTGDTDATAFEDTYRGEWDSVLDYATELFDDIYLHDVPESVRSYIDYEAFARDLELGGDIWSHRDGSTVYIFDNH